MGCLEQKLLKNLGKKRVSGPVSGGTEMKKSTSHLRGVYNLPSPAPQLK